MVCASSWTDTRAMPTITKTKPMRNRVAPSAENPWDAVAGVLERLGEGQRAILVVQVGAADNPLRTKHRRRRCERASE